MIRAALIVPMLVGTAILVGVVSLGASQKAARATVDHGYHIPEARVSRLPFAAPAAPQGESVTIPNLAKDVDSLGPVNKSGLFDWCQWSIHLSKECELAGWADIEIAKWLGENSMGHFRQRKWQDRTSCPQRKTICRSLTSIAAAKGNPDSGFGEDGLIVFVDFSKYVSPQLSPRGSNYNNQRTELKESGNRDESGDTQVDPITRRLFLALLGVCGGFFLALNAPDDERRILRAASVSGGCLLAGGGLVLLWLDAFPFTWGWLL
jgi:hypothetical protein